MSETPARVLIAHGESSLRQSAMDIARQAGYQVIGVGDGESARLVLRSAPPPAALVVDVALPDVLGYELCDEISRLGLPTVTILVASVYSKTAYKRQPGSLYGAADYVEQHHLVDQLPEKLHRCLSDREPPAIEHDPEAQSAAAAVIREAGEGMLAFRYRSVDEGEARARSLARLLIADMMLYGGDLVEAWRTVGAPGDFPEALRADVLEARRLYELRVPAELTSAKDYFDETLRGVFSPRARAQALGEENNE